jgi:hypothetical protein
MRQWQGARGSCTLWRVPAEPKKLAPLLIHESCSGAVSTDRHRATPAATPGRGRGHGRERGGEQGGLCLGARPAVRPAIVLSFLTLPADLPSRARIACCSCCLLLLLLLVLVLVLVLLLWARSSGPAHSPTGGGGGGRPGRMFLCGLAHAHEPAHAKGTSRITPRI